MSKSDDTFIDIITIPCKYIWYDSRSYDVSFRKTLQELEVIEKYPWMRLYNDILNNGLQKTPKVIIERCCSETLPKLSSEYKYHVSDGNHRLRILEEINGSNGLIEVELHLPCVAENKPSYTYKPLDVEKRLKEMKSKIYEG